MQNSQFPSPSLAETFEKLMIPLSPPCGGRCHGVTEGGSSHGDQIGIAIGNPPSAFGISPARGAKGTYSKVSARGEKGSYASVSARGRKPRTYDSDVGARPTGRSQHNNGSSQ